MSLKKIALVAVVLLAAVISFTIIAPWAADPVNHVSSIEKTENKISAVMTLSGGAAGASATLSVLPGDLCTPLATELAELAKYFLIILSALYLEKFLITISGYITFSVLIPLALIIVAAVIISGNKRFLSLAGKLAIIGVIIYLIVPASTIVSAAQAAFCALAESFAANVGERDYLSVILAKCAFANELYKNEDAVADWVVSALNTIKSMKNPQTVKQACAWNKVGAKVSTGFSLFK